MIEKNILFKKWTFCNDPSAMSINLPFSLKRGLSDISKLALSAYNELNFHSPVPLVCATRYGSQQQVFKIKEQLASEGDFSPTIFSKLSNNIFGSLIMMTENNNYPYTVISAGENSFEMGLLESFLQIEKTIVFVYAEESSPAPLDKIRSSTPLAFALVIEQNGNYKVKFHEKSQDNFLSINHFIKFLNNSELKIESTYFTLEKLK